MKIGRYVLRSAVPATLVCMAAFTGLYIAVDGFGRLDDFVREMETWGGALRFMVRYYALHLPLIFIYIAPFAVLMAALFTLARLEKHNELLAAKACGIGLRKIAAPILTLCFVISCIMYVNRQWVIPYLADDIEESERMVQRKGKRQKILTNVFLPDSSGTWFVVGRYDPATLSCQDTWIISSASEGKKVRYASTAVLDRDGFRVKQGTDLGDGGPKPISDEVIRTDLRADDFIARASHMRLRSYTDLLRLLGRNPRARDVAVMLHRNLSFPLVILVIPLIGMSLMFVREGAGTYCPVGIAILVCFMYFALGDVSCEIARQGLLSPGTGGWAPISIFSAAGVYLFTRMRT